MDNDTLRPENTPLQAEATPPPASTTQPAQPPLEELSQLEPAPQHEGWRNALSTILVLLIAPLIAVLLTAFVFQSYEVSGPSMQTTLNSGDRLIIWKTARTWARITGNAYIPARGDVVVFVERGLPEGQKQLIKRVVALPGERVKVANGTLTVYNAEHPEGFQPDTSLPYGKVITETLATSSQTEWTVGMGEVFVCGDNRSNSSDSRMFGPVSSNDIVGKLAIRVLPLNQAKRF